MVSSTGVAELTSQRPPSDWTYTTFQGDGYTINVPTGFAYQKAADGHDTWHSSNYDILGVQWELDTPNSQVAKLEQANTIDLTAKEIAVEQAVVSHPAVGGASAATMIEHPLGPGTYGIYLFVHAYNDHIYFVYGISQSLSAQNALHAAVVSFTARQ
ncbi:MAG: hypothetical protein ABR881_32320 [Candidatus Sulfotelmatobacter sp.]|jgi:hypothetical protein